MTLKTLHYFSGLTLSIFIGLHLFNHFCSLAGIASHIAVMETLRKFYRNPFIETIIIAAVVVQMISGLTLARKKRKFTLNGFAKLQVWTGLYLAFFLLIHVSAVMAGRHLLHVDTNFYFAAAGLNSFPLALFFVPYYGLSVVSVFGHIAAIHSKNMRHSVLGLTPHLQAKLILLSGVIAAITILFAFTGRFWGTIHL